MRLIPAHAGKTRDWQRRSGPPTAHPRSRGENRPGTSCSVTRGGSSPLTRGKRVRRCCALDEGRLIPAHAGKTASRNPRPCPSGAHPRSRGENSQETVRAPSGYGSSPLTRGKLYSMVRV